MQGSSTTSAMFTTLAYIRGETGWCGITAKVSFMFMSISIVVYYPLYSILPCQKLPGTLALFVVLGPACLRTIQLFLPSY